MFIIFNNKKRAYQEFKIKKKWVEEIIKWVEEIICLTMYWNYKTNFKKSFCHRIKKLYKSETGLTQIKGTQKCHMTIAENKTLYKEGEWRLRSKFFKFTFKGTSIK